MLPQFLSNFLVNFGFSVHPCVYFCVENKEGASCGCIGVGGEEGAGERRGGDS